MTTATQEDGFTLKVRTGEQGAGATSVARAPASPRKLVLRRSAVEAMLMCPLFVSGDAENARFGTTFHSFAAAYTLLCQRLGEETRMADVERLARETWFDHPRGLPPARWPEFADLCDRFARTHAVDLRTLLGVEETLVADVGEWIFTGTVDRLDRLDDGDVDDDPVELAVTDYKTQWAIEEHAFQLRFYGALACRRWPGLQVVHTIADHVRLGDAGVLRTEHSRDELLDFLDDVVFAVGRALATPPAAVGCALCQYCRDRGGCGSSLAPVAPVRTADQAVDAASRLIRLEAAVTEQRAALRDYLKDADPITVGGLEVGYLSPREPSWRAVRPLAVARHLVTRGLEGQKVLRVEADAVPPRFRDELVEAGLAVEERGRPSFRTRKAARS